MPVGGWLRGLGLGEYEDRFRDSKINADVLADLTDGDPEKLGLPVGDRKRLLRGIATLASREQPPTEARLATPRFAAQVLHSRGLRRTPSDHNHVLRSRRLDEHRR